MVPLVALYEYLGLVALEGGNNRGGRKLGFIIGNGRGSTEIQPIAMEWVSGMNNDLNH